jgi:uncharacterized protein (TIGR02246 family)
MMRQMNRSKLALLAAAAAALTACAQPVAENTKPDQTGKDEAAIRQLLDNLAQKINADDIGFVDVFAKDAVIIAPSAPDVVGYDAIRAMYQGVMQQSSMAVHFSTAEIAVAGDLAYEHGTYTLRIVEKKTGKVLQDVRNKDLHIFKRQPDGAWKTWRMMVNSADPPPVATK